MSVQNISRRAGPYVGTGLTSEFAFGFKVFTRQDVRVVRSDTADENATETTLKLDTDYTVVLNGDQDSKPGGEVRLKSPLANGLRLAITSAITPDQTMVLTNHDGFSPDTLNDAHDKAISLIQELKEETARTLKTPITSSKTPEELTNELLSAQKDARKFADAAQKSAEEAKKSEEKTKEYAEAATVIVPFKDEIKVVADNINDVVPVGQAIEDVKAVASIKTEVTTVSGAVEEIKTAAQPENLEAYKTVASIKDQVVTDAEISEEIVKVAGMKEHVVNVSTNMVDVNNVSQNMEDINKVAGDLEGGKCTPVKFSAGRITDEPAQDCTAEGGNIKTVADHIVQVDKVAAAADSGALDKAANSIETTLENVRRAEAAQAAAESARDVAETAKTGAESSAQASSESAKLAKRWATQVDTPVEGDLYGAMYYAQKALDAQGSSSQILESVKQAGQNAVTEITQVGGSQVTEVREEGKRQVQSVQAAGAEQTSNAKNQADAAKESATQAAHSASEADRSAKTAGFAFRLCTKELKDHASTPLTMLSPSVNTKVGDSVVDVKGFVFSVVSVDETNFTVGVSYANIRGPQGPQGVGIDVMDSLESEEELHQKYPTGEQGQCVIVGKKVYTWSPSKNQWVASGDLMIGSGAASSVEWDQVQNKPPLTSFDELVGEGPLMLNLDGITYEVI